MLSNIYQQHNIFRRHNRNREDNSTNSPSSTNNDNNESNDTSNNNNNSYASSSFPIDEEANDEEDNILIVPIPSSHNNNNNILSPSNLTFIPQQTSQQRRDAILAEVERVQRANFIHFALLCLVPTSLLLIVIAAIISEDGECNVSGEDGVTVCERESRSFVNAFTTRCVCDAVRSVANSDGTATIEDGEDGGSGGLF